MISVIIPVYNAANYLEKCIESVLASTYQDLEVILVENGSTDNTWEICKKYRMLNLNVNIYQTDILGASNARNVGLEHAKGEWISFVDVDDYISPYFYEILYNCAKENAADLVYCSYMMGNEKDYFFSQVIHAEFRSVTLDQFMESLYLKTELKSSALWNKLIRKECVEQIRLDNLLRYCEDRNYITKCICNVKQICYIDEPLYYYYRGNENACCNSADNSVRMDMIYSLQKDRMYLEQNFGEEAAKYLEMVDACILQSADFRMKRVKEENNFELQKELKSIIKAALRNVKRAKNIAFSKKIFFLSNHYCPWLLKFCWRIYKKLRKI